MSERAAPAPPAQVCLASRLLRFSIISSTAVISRTARLLAPRPYSNIRAAWVDSWDQAPGQILRIEAAAYQGRPVFFKIVGLWTPPVRTELVVKGNFTFPTPFLFAVVMPSGAGLLAWRNDRLGDRRGAFPLASVQCLPKTHNDAEGRAKGSARVAVMG
jgi:hypothetical protein